MEYMFYTVAEPYHIATGSNFGPPSAAQVFGPRQPRRPEGEPRSRQSTAPWSSHAAGAPHAPVAHHTSTLTHGFDVTSTHMDRES